ncbi:MAG: TraM recognition domain-containing protein [Candidatus Binatia bacterium]
MLGALLVTKIGLAGLSRADVPEETRRDFYFYLDEFQNFATLSLANMLSELRKYRINMILAHQYLSQLDPQVKDAVLGNVGTIISFRLGLTDAEMLSGEFYPFFSASDLINLPNYHIYLRLMIDGVVSQPFSGETLA